EGDRHAAGLPCRARRAVAARHYRSRRADSRKTGGRRGSGSGCQALPRLGERRLPDNAGDDRQAGRLMMQVLAVTPEIFPLIKTGGLADVAGALPGALGEHGVAVRTLIPGYPVVMAALERSKALHLYADLQGGAASIHAAR